MTLKQLCEIYGVDQEKLLNAEVGKRKGVLTINAQMSANDRGPDILELIIYIEDRKGV